MSRKTRLSSILVAAAVCAATAQVSAEPIKGSKPLAGPLCSSPQPLPQTGEPRLPAKAGTPADCSGTASNLTSDYDPVELYTVTVVVHILMDSTCTQGVISDATVADQMRVLNEDFLALPGSNGANGADTQIRFELATVDPDGNPTTGITRSCNDTWYNDGGNYWETLAWDPGRYVNIYTNTVNGAGGYVPFFAFDSPQLVGTSEDRIVVNSLGFGTGGPVLRRSLGHLTVHEMGHYLGLVHTFIGGCGIASAPGCYTTGDLICDTAPDETSLTGCPIGATGCGGVPAPIDNYMALTDDQCLEGFTFEQGQRMRCTLLNYRPGIFTAASTVCGDGVREGNEECDGADLGGLSCADLGCSSGTLSCTASCTLDVSGCGDCSTCDLDGVCESGEDCDGCPSDCPSGTTAGAACGNGLCEAGNGEDCVSCPADCNGRQSGKPANRFCCGDGDGQNPVSCGDARCTSSGFSCTGTPVSPVDYCCGDLLCEGDEDAASCALDCS